MSKFIIKAGPYGNEIVLGTITKELYEKYRDDSVELRKSVTTTGESGDLNEWFDILMPVFAITAEIIEGKD